MNYSSHTVSVVIVTHNNVASLERTLDSVKWADELIVVDRGSTDGTIELVRRYTEKVYFHPSKHANVLKNHAISMAKGDWVLLLEPGEWVEEMLKHEIDGILLNPLQHDGYTIPRKFYFQGQCLMRGHLYPNRELRLFRGKKGQAVDDVYYSGVTVPGEVKVIDNALGYEPYANLQQVFEGFNELSTRAAYKLLESGKQSPFKVGTLNLLLRPPLTFLRRYVLNMGMKDGFGGLTLALARGYYTFMKYGKFKILLTPKY